MRILMILMAAAACIVAVLLFYKRNRLNKEMKNDELSANERLKDEIRRSDFDDEAYRRHEAVKLQRISGLRREDESVADTVISYMSERAEKAGLSLEIKDREKIRAFFAGFEEKDVVGFLYNMLENALEAAEGCRLSAGVANGDAEEAKAGSDDAASGSDVDMRTGADVAASGLGAGRSDIVLCYEDGVGVVCRNVFEAGRLVRDELGYKTSKTSGKHGYGLFAMKKIAGVYGLSFEAFEEKSVFIVSVGK